MAVLFSIDFIFLYNIIKILNILISNMCRHDFV